MNDKYKGAIEASLRPSRAVAAFIAVAALATDVLIAATPLPDWVQGLAVAWTSGAALWALRGARRGHVLALDREGQVAVDGRAGAMRAGSFVAPAFTVIRWRPAGAYLDRTLLVARDALDEAQLRELRVLVKWGETLYSQPTPAEPSAP